MGTESLTRMKGEARELAVERAFTSRVREQSIADGA